MSCGPPLPKISFVTSLTGSSVVSVSVSEEGGVEPGSTFGSRKTRLDRCVCTTLSYSDQSWFAVGFGGGDLGVSVGTSGRGAGCLPFGGVLASVGFACGVTGFLASGGGPPFGGNGALGSDGGNFGGGGKLAHLHCAFGRTGALVTSYMLASSGCSCAYLSHSSSRSLLNVLTLSRAVARDTSSQTCSQISSTASSYQRSTPSGGSGGGGAFFGTDNDSCLGFCGVCRDCCCKCEGGGLESAPFAGPGFGFGTCCCNCCCSCREGGGVFCGGLKFITSTRK